MRHYCNRQNVSKRDISRINRQIMPPRFNTSSTSTESINDVIVSQNSDISLPPGGDYRALEKIENDTSDEYIDIDDGLQMSYSDYAQGGAISQRSGYKKQLEEDARGNSLECRGCQPSVYEMEGYVYNPPQVINEIGESMGEISMQQIDVYDNTLMHMSAYLQRCKGKYICVDLWTQESRSIEKCGILTEIGNNFLVIKSVRRNGCATMIDFKTIRYVSVYCR